MKVAIGMTIVVVVILIVLPTIIVVPTFWAQTQQDTIGNKTRTNFNHQNCYGNYANETVSMQKFYFCENSFFFMLDF